MKYIGVILVAILMASTVQATQWGSRTLAPGLNTSAGNYPATILSNGTVYELTNNTLYRHTYASSYTWNSGVQCNFPDTLRTITIDPAGGIGIVCESTASTDIRWTTSSDGINWVLGDIISGWNRSGHYPTSVTCGWRSVNKELQVDYEDGKKFWAPYPYTNPQEITNLGFVVASGLRFTGDYLAMSNNTDLYESFGSGGTWSTRQPITEVNTGDPEVCPILGAIGGYNILLWSAPGSVGGYDIWYSKGNSNAGVSPASLGKVKAMFK